MGWGGVEVTRVSTLNPRVAQAPILTLTRAHAMRRARGSSETKHTLEGGRTGADPNTNKQHTDFGGRRLCGNTITVVCAVATLRSPLPTTYVPR